MRQQQQQQQRRRQSNTTTTMALRAVQLVVLTTLFGACTSYEGCKMRYGRRGCFHRILHGVLVTCDGRGVETQIPQGLTRDTVYLSLSNFKLDALTREDFMRFPAVECMTIVDSGVTSIAPDTFSEMENLRELVMENTSIHNGHLNFLVDPRFKASLVTLSRSPSLRFVNISVTPNLREIKTLGLSNNNIEVIDGGLFTELRNTEKLILSYNRLRTLDWLKLKEMTHLNKLSLDHNRFQSIPESVHSVFFAVKELSLAGNPLHCNCKLRWLREFYESAVDKTMDYHNVVCVSPHDMEMHRVIPDNFVCSKPSKPVIQWVRLDNDRYEVNCSSVGDPAPTLMITLPEERTVITPPSDELSKTSTVTPQMLSSPGQILCEAENTEGTMSIVVDLPEIAVAGSRSIYHVTWTTQIVCSVVVVCRLSFRDLR